MRILGVLVFFSVLALAYANLKDIGVEQQRVIPFQAPQLYRPIVNFPCNYLSPRSSTCVYQKLCVTLAGILKVAGCLLLLRVACFSLVRLHHGKALANGHLLRHGAHTGAKLAEIVQSRSAQAPPAPEPASGDSSSEESLPTHSEEAGDRQAPAVEDAAAVQEQPHAAPKKSGAAGAPDAASLLQSGLGRLTAVLAVNHALTSLSVKAIVPTKGPAKDLTDLCLPITTPPTSAHLLSSARLAISTALHRCFPGGPFHTPAAPQKGWQVPSTPYVPINYNGVSFANWASAMFCKKRSSRPPKAPTSTSTTAAAPARTSSSSSRRRRQRVPTSTVFPAVPVPVLKHHHLTTASAPSMTAEELVVVNNVLDLQLDDVTSFLFD